MDDGVQHPPELGDDATRSALIELGADPAVQLTEAERAQLPLHPLRVGGVHLAAHRLH